MSHVRAVFARVILPLLLPLAAGLSGAPVLAADISADEDCTLAQAIVSANFDRAVGECEAGNGADTITLSQDVTLIGDPLPTIRTDITINGDDFAISGAEKSAIFIIENANVTVNSLTIKDGLTGTRGGAFQIDGGSLTLTNSSVEYNQALDSGGGIYANDAKVTLTSTVIQHNTAGRGGGAGIYIAGTKGNTHELTISESVFTSNSASQDGGAIHAAGGSVEIKKSGFQNNSADEGGVIEIWNGSLVMHNTTMNSNSAREGGAVNAGADLVSTASVELVHNTFTSNTANERGASIAMTGINATLSIGNTWISGTLDEGILHCDPGVSPYSVLENSANYIQDNSCPDPDDESSSDDEEEDTTESQAQSSAQAVESTEAQTAAEDESELSEQSAEDEPALSEQSAEDELEALKLSALKEIEGVIYHELLEGNPAIDAANNGLCSQLDDPVDDVVNTRRPQGPACDIGAWEFPAPDPGPPLRQPDPPDPPDPPDSPDPPDPPDAPDPPGPRICPDVPAGYLVRAYSPDVRCEPVVIADIDKHPLMNAGVEQAFIITGDVAAGVEFCFSGGGTLVLEDDSVSPATATRLPLYELDGMLCAHLPGPGKVVHVAELTDDTAIPLTNCQVTTSNVSRLRDAPAGSNILGLVPFNITLSSEARTANWFLVDYRDQSGWISVDLVQTEGACD